MNASHRISRQLSAYLDGELSPEEMADVRSHLDRCADCREDLEAIRATKRLLGRLEPPPLPADFAEGLRARLARDALRRLAWAPARWQWWPRPAAVLLAAALAVVLITVPAVRGHLDRLRAAEVGPDLFLQAATQAAAEDPFMDRAFLGLVRTDASIRLVGEDPRGPVR
ncbi:MAG: anti-sigma factor [Armatimonadota bacterium]|nr:anti-sigma factor [Armatimonadota bacterium]MDR7518924.1 anti-sigma factor [Armatimonadota bacterium]MDR7550632.1 anti-sigma factor [Armatimonadota bacterium]